KYNNIYNIYYMFHYEHIKCTSEEIYEKNKHLLYINPQEIINAEKLMNDAVTHLEHHATSKDGYKLCDKFYVHRMYFYKKKHKKHTDVEKIQYTIDDSNKYNKIINKLWDPDSDDFLYRGVVKSIQNINN
ncbi:hypothetical protein, partial [Plasmodium yoelii yoelii]